MGLKTTPFVMPFDHVYVFAPLAVRVNAWPAQIVLAEQTTDKFGDGKTVTAIIELVDPQPLETVTE